MRHLWGGLPLDLRVKTHIKMHVDVIEKSSYILLIPESPLGEGFSFNVHPRGFSGGQSLGANPLFYLVFVAFENGALVREW